MEDTRSSGGLNLPKRKRSVIQQGDPIEIDNGSANLFGQLPSNENTTTRKPFSALLTEFVEELREELDKTVVANVELQALITQKDSLITKKEVVISEKGVPTTKNNAHISEKDTQLVTKNLFITELDKLIAYCGKEIVDDETEIEKMRTIEENLINLRRRYLTDKPRANTSDSMTNYKPTFVPSIQPTFVSMMNYRPTSYTPFPTFDLMIKYPSRTLPSIELAFDPMMTFDRTKGQTSLGSDKMVYRFESFRHDTGETGITANDGNLRKKDAESIAKVDELLLVKMKGESTVVAQIMDSHIIERLTYLLVMKDDLMQTTNKVMFSQDARIKALLEERSHMSKKISRMSGRNDSCRQIEDSQVIEILKDLLVMKEDLAQITNKVMSSQDATIKALSEQEFRMSKEISRMLNDSCQQM